MNNFLLLISVHPFTSKPCRAASPLRCSSPFNYSSVCLQQKQASLSALLFPAPRIGCNGDLDHSTPDDAWLETVEDTHAPISISAAARLHSVRWSGISFSTNLESFKVFRMLQEDAPHWCCQLLLWSSSGFRPGKDGDQGGDGKVIFWFKCPDWGTSPAHIRLV